MQCQEFYMSRVTCTGALEPLFAVTPPRHTEIMNSTDQTQLVFPLFELPDQDVAPKPKKPRQRSTSRSREQARLAAKRGAAQARLAILEGSQRAAQRQAQIRAERREQLQREFNTASNTHRDTNVGPAHVIIRSHTESSGSTPPSAA